MDVTFFNNVGRFVQTLQGDLEAVIDPTIKHLGLPWVDGVFDDSFMLVDGRVKKRPDNPCILVGQQLTNLPETGYLCINGRWYEFTGPVVDLEFDQPGGYVVRVESWPYLDKEFTVENPTQ